MTFRTWQGGLADPPPAIPLRHASRGTLTRMRLGLKGGPIKNPSQVGKGFFLQGLPQLFAYHVS